ncbi:hypothetical protein LTR27_010707 [Elasticomyces elasticus]|nr:hypothetical protein LTR27_010707 [Elasticomyces elasticus]
MVYNNTEEKSKTGSTASSSSGKLLKAVTPRAAKDTDKRSSTYALHANQANASQPTAVPIPAPDTPSSTQAPQAGLTNESQRAEVPAATTTLVPAAQPKTPAWGKTSTAGPLQRAALTNSRTGGQLRQGPALIPGSAAALRAAPASAAGPRSQADCLPSRLGQMQISGSSSGPSPPPQRATASQNTGVYVPPHRANGNTSFYKASEGPSPSIVTTAFRPPRPDTNASRMSTPRLMRTSICKLSGKTRTDYRKGDVISIPFHQANTNPHVDPDNDRNFTMTLDHGAVYSKRRMMVVLFVHTEDLFCLPLYSWNSKGILHKPESLKAEYISMMNSTDTSFVNHAMYDPVVIE